MGLVDSTILTRINDMSEWISVEDRLPEQGDYSVFAAFDNGSVEPVSSYNFPTDMVHVEDWLRDKVTPKITHWMPLPEPPKD